MTYYKPHPTKNLTLSRQNPDYADLYSRIDKHQKISFTEQLFTKQIGTTP